MADLRRGIRLYLPASSPGAPRVLLSAGIARAAEEAGPEMPYPPEAFLPATPWRAPTPAEEEILRGSGPSADPASTVAVLSAPAEVLDAFETAGVREARTCRELEEAARRGACREALEHGLGYFRSLCAPGESLEGAGLAARPGGLLSTTREETRGCHIGLHLDSWEQLPLDQRHRAGNRISINLGREERSLLFVNLPVEDMVFLLRAILPEERFRACLRRATDFVQEFLRCHPAYPVVRVRVAPGEAYLAPTENMIHDGCTEGARCLDVTLTARGRLRAPAWQEGGQGGGH